MQRFSFWSLALFLTAGVWLSPLTHGYYGTDDRREIYELSGADLADSDSVVALFPDSQVLDRGDGTSALLTVQYGEYFNLCPSEPFWDQPAGSFCSGVLVAPDIIATAGHCTADEDISTLRFVFGYHMRDEHAAQTVISNRDIFQGVEVIAWQLDENTGADWALIRLDRKVLNHPVAKIRTQGTIGDREAVQLIGHPKGLPAKFAGGALVRDNRYRAFFIANLDSYKGNSGSPVFNSTTHAVEGILVRGKDPQFIKQGNCYVSRVCPDTGCSGEDVTRTTEFVHLIP